jgi:uracil-DNA glycosylase family 4
VKRVKALVHLINPKVIMLVGRVAFRSLTGYTEGISRNRGTDIPYEFMWKGSEWCKFAAVPVWHPAYILRNRNLLEDWKADIRVVEKYL